MPFLLLFYLASLIVFTSIYALLFISTQHHCQDGHIPAKSTERREVADGPKAKRLA
jgi:hypothetical protein